MKQTSEGYVLAPAILRLLAFMIDLAVLVVIQLALMETLGVVQYHDDGRPVNAESVVLPIVVAAIYNIAFVAYKGATIGKMAMSIYVCYPDGERVRPDTAILRHVISLIESIIVIGSLVSVVLLFTDSQRRTIHDRVAGTIVLAGQLGKPLKVSDVERSEQRGP